MELHSGDFIWSFKSEWNLILSGVPALMPSPSQTAWVFHMPLDYSVTSNYADLNPLCSTLVSNGTECCLLWPFSHEQKLGTNILKEI